MFEAASVELPARSRMPVAKTFRRFDPAQGLLLPPSVQE